MKLRGEFPGGGLILGNDWECAVRLHIDPRGACEKGLFSHVSYKMNCRLSCSRFLHAAQVPWEIELGRLERVNGIESVNRWPAIAYVCLLQPLSACLFLTT